MGLEIVVVLLTAVLALSWAAKQLGVSPPVLLLVGGVLIGLIPHYRHLHVPPNLVLLIFLPPLLYAESVTISVQQIRANLRVIIMLSVGLVLITVLTVAETAVALGLSVTTAFVLGAVVAPTDATAVASVAHGMPRRIVTTVRAESLVNDGTALVVFAVAVEIAEGEHSFGWWNTTWRFAASYAGGMAIGAAVALLVIAVRRRLHDTAIESGLSVLTPFAAYLPAEAAHVSGVLAVVVCGLIMSWASPLLIRASSRLQVFSFWDVTSFLLNRSLFVLVGIQLPDAVRDLHSVGPAQAVGLAAAVSGVVIATRLAYLHTTPYLVRAVDRRPQQRARRVGFRVRMPIAWAGVRGAVSLAAALAVPTVTVQGTELRDRDVIVFVTAVVIVVTLVLQGQTLPAMVRWARMPPDVTAEDEELLARQRVAQSALDELNGRAARAGAPSEVVELLADELGRSAESVAEEPMDASEYELRRALIGVKRGTLVELRNARRIDDTVLRRVQKTLDAEETALDLRRSASLLTGSGTPPDPDGGGGRPGRPGQPGRPGG